jgi:hypothetical protein
MDFTLLWVEVGFSTASAVRFRQGRSRDSALTRILVEIFYQDEAEAFRILNVGWNYGRKADAAAEIRAITP